MNQDIINEQKDEFYIYPENSINQLNNNYYA